MKQAGADLRDLVSAYQGGDAAALDAIVLRLKKPMLLLATRILRDPIAAEDAFIEAMARLLPLLRDFVPPEAFVGYAMRAVRNASIDLLRSRSLRDSRRALVDTAAMTAAEGPGDLPLAERLVDRSPDPEALALRREQQRAVRHELGCLKDPGKTCIRMYYEEGASYGEIAAALGLSQSSVKRQLAATRALLAVRLRALREAGHVD